MKRFERLPDSDPFAVSDRLSKFLARRRKDIQDDVDFLEKRVPGITAAPTFQTHSPGSWEEINHPHYVRNNTLYQLEQSSYGWGFGVTGAGTVVPQAA
jgi:hypothetical protein